MTPEDVLVNYIKEMNLWEHECAQRDQNASEGHISHDAAAKEGMKKLQPILDKYCSQRNEEPREFDYSIPPSYDPENEKVVEKKELSAVVVEIRTEEGHRHRDRYIYRLAIENGEWKICEKYLLAHDGELVPANL
jgi:hypothetical protein